ncbi:MAG: hypothetical protein HN704_14740 [Bacteroidetes bacterium]|jgi:hypothetical protein|nr:hypothetical protein [Bacteroidota bacterium]MBT7492855.1 hypothetical protein [Bacteroidota bacterium]
MKYIKKIKTTLRKTNKHAGEMDDVFNTKSELNSVDLSFYENGMLIFVEDENQVYKIYQKEILTCEN